MTQESQNNNAMLIHLSALSSFFIPFGNLILPIILWQSLKKDNSFVDHHGKEAVNFNLSFFLYNIIIGAILVATVLGTVFSAIKLGDIENPEGIGELLFSTGGLLFSLIILGTIGVIKLIIIIVAAIKAGQGGWYRYPLTIRFIK